MTDTQRTATEQLLISNAVDQAVSHLDFRKLSGQPVYLDAQYLVCEMLRAFGHEADGVGHPDDALARLAAGRYDLLFTDVSLPGMSGVDLARRARRLGTRAPGVGQAGPARRRRDRRVVR